MLFVLAFLITVIFFVLYHKPIFSKDWYAYSDTGCDTVDQYIPMTSYDSRSFLSGETDRYSLTFGLGKNNDFQWYKYLNPVNLPLLLLGTTHIRIAFLLSTYLKYLLIGLFSWFFFRRLLDHPGIAMVCALLWTYSGYNVLWGQHYQFLTGSLAFTVFLLGLQMILDRDRKMLLAPLLFLPLAATSYLTFYQSCFFALFYGVTYLCFKKKRPSEIAGTAGLFAIGCVLALGMGGDYVYSSMMNFFSSTRMNSVSSVNLNGFYSLKYIGSYFARFLSNDTMGIAWSYTGPANYYEAVMLAVSAMTVFSVIWLLQTKYVKRVCCITAVCGLSLSLPIVSHILGFKATTHRWGYLIVILEVMLIGYGLRELTRSYKQGKEGDFAKKAYISILVSDVSLLVGALILAAIQERASFRLDKKSIVIVACCYFMYTVVMLALVYLSRHERIRIRPELILAGLLLCCTVELIVMNYRSINSRLMVTAEQWNEGMYNDGTVEAVEYIKSIDTGLYRVNKIYDSVYYDDQLIQDYYGLGSYYSLNTRELVDTYTTLGNKLRETTDTLNGTNYIRFPGDKILDNTILAAKYVISREDVVPDPAFYEKINEVSGLSVYLNRFWNGFGNIYGQVIGSEEFGKREEKELALSSMLVTDDEELIRDFRTSETPTSAELEENLLSLQQNGSVQLSEGKNRFYGEVSNRMDHNGILCVPILNDGRWTVSVDGNEEKMYLVDGGLIGVVIAPGDHQIEFTYTNNTARTGRIIGAAFAVLYGIVLVGVIKKKNERN